MKRPCVHIIHVSLPAKLYCLHCSLWKTTKTGILLYLFFSVVHRGFIALVLLG
ncbi:hypothetical protein BDP27DRAFT_1320025 [Rhodocollybia butyracea]|uniref:Uncharacterized protein n=1 Tax=Rhodocollybia butyracea TaxID=206335 RepID=A0A9P5Q0V9_9AGAR|nr:hypothetical protein BDP27DRAFT_1320025 [Rhodocollybia butyracea]